VLAADSCQYKGLDEIDEGQLTLLTIGDLNYRPKELGSVTRALLAVRKLVV